MYKVNEAYMVGSVHAYGIHIYYIYYIMCLICQSASQTSIEGLLAEEELVKMFEVKKLFNQVHVGAAFLKMSLKGNPVC